MSVEAYREPPDTNLPNRFYRERQSATQSRPTTVQRLTEWAESAIAAHEVAESLVKTSFVPKAFRDKPHEATAAILAGDEVGLSPMASLRAFDIIEGTAAPNARTHRAVVQSFGHAIWVVESTANRAVVRGQRAGESQVQESTWTIERARLQGLAGKETYRKMPTSMLLARATSECARLVASDALMGMPYSVEELSDGILTEIEGGPQGQAPEPAAPARRTTRRRSQPRAVAAAPTPTDEPSVEPSDPPLPGEDGYSTDNTESGETEPAPINDEQLTALQATFTDAGINNRETRLEASGLIVGRDITTAKDLTQEEATRLLTQLVKWSGEGKLAETVAELVTQANESGSPENRAS